MEKWYVVYVHVRHEKKVGQRLSEKGVQAYIPVVKRLQQWSDRKKWVEFPMIGGYVFVKADLVSQKEKILTDPAVLSFIRFEGKEAVIPQQEIDILRSIELTGFDVSEAPGELRLGDAVEISQGHLKGIAGWVVQLQNEDYVQIELENIRQSLRVKVPKQILKTKNVQNKLK